MASRGRNAQTELTPEIYDAEEQMHRLLVGGIANDGDIAQLNEIYRAYGHMRNRGGIRPEIIPMYIQAFNIKKILKAAQELIAISQRGTGGHALATVGSYLGLSQATPPQQDLAEQMAEVLVAAATNQFIANIANEREYDPYQSPNEGAQDGTQNDYSAITSLQRLWEIWNRLATSQQNKGAHGERRAVASVTDKMANLENAIKYRAKMGQFPGITEAQVLELIEREGAEEAQRRLEEQGHTNSSYHHKKKSGNSNNGQSKQGGRRKRKHKKRRKTRKHKKGRKTRKHKKRKRRKTKRRR